MYAEKLAELCRSAGFQVVDNRYVQRETVNHKDSISVGRIFIQGRFVKPPAEFHHNESTSSSLSQCSTTQS